jgi:hypothetical protein
VDLEVVCVTVISPCVDFGFPRGIYILQYHGDSICSLEVSSSPELAKGVVIGERASGFQIPRIH